MIKSLKKFKSWWRGAGKPYADPPFPDESFGDFNSRLDIHNQARTQHIENWLATYRKPGKEIVLEHILGIIAIPGWCFYQFCDWIHYLITGSPICSTPASVPFMYYFVLASNVAFYLLLGAIIFLI